MEHDTDAETASAPVALAHSAAVAPSVLISRICSARYIQASREPRLCIGASPCSVPSDRHLHLHPGMGTLIVVTTQPREQTATLPIPLTPLIGREQDVAVVRTLCNGRMCGW